MGPGKLLWTARLLAFRKLFAIALTISFTLAPVSTALAQEAATDSAATDTEASNAPPASESTDPAPAPTPNLSIPGVDSISPPLSPDTTSDAGSASTGAPSDDTTLSTTPDTPTDDATLSAKPPAASPASMSGEGGGAGDPHSDDDRKAIGDGIHIQPDSIAGSASHSYPISLPPGRNGLTPNLSLSYSSGQGSNVSTVGYGWDVSIPFIQRINRNGTDAMFGQYLFYSTMDGELSSTTPGGNMYGARFEKGSFLKYLYSTSSNAWIVTDKSGTVYKFGSSAASRQDNPSDSSQIYKWELDEIRDTNNNYIKYTYTKDTGQIYANQILYTGNGSTDGPFEVDFLKENRSDIASSSQPGFQIVSRSRINEIDVKVSGTWVRKYTLSYTTGDNQSRSLLSAIQQSGQNDAGTVVTQPSTTFNYQTAIPSWTATSTSWNAPLALTNFQITTNGDTGVRIADVNGDGLPDMIQAYKNSDASFTAQQAWINTGFGFTSSSTWIPPLYLTDAHIAVGGDVGTRIVDVNGDGLPDIVQSWNSSDSSSSSTATYINTGSGWVASSTWNAPIFIANYQVNVNGGDVGVRFMDVNGDGLVDILQSFNRAGNIPTQGVYLNTGNGWSPTPSATWTIPAYFSDTQNTLHGDIGVRVADVNGDGLPDIVQSYRNIDGTIITKNAWINTGTGWAQDKTWIPPAFFGDFQAVGDREDAGTRLVDANGDGLPDIIQSYNNADSSASTSIAYLNTGSGWATSTPWTPPVFIINYQVYGDQGIQAVDWDGDNMADLVQGIARHVGDGDTFITYLNNAKRTDLLTRVTLPTGGQNTYQYRQSALYASGPNAQLNPHLPLNLDTISAMGVSDGLGTISTTTYSYSGGTYYFNGPFDRKLAGFSKVIQTDNAGNYSNTFYHTGNGTDSAHGEYQDSEAKIGNTYRVERYDASSNLLSKDITRWDQINLGGTRYFVFPQSTVSSAYASGGTHRDSANKTIYENTYGNIIQKLQYGEVTGSDDGTFSDTGTDFASTTITYVASTSPYIVGLSVDELTQDQSSNKVRETRHYYDNLSLGTVGIGNETKTENWITSSTYASTTKTYDGTYGLVTQSRDADGNLTTNTLDGKNLYVATSTNALSQATGYQYDYSTGKVKATYDPNNRLYTTLYDGLGRPLTLGEPDPSNGSLVTKTVYTYTDSNTPGSTSILKTDYQSSATTSATYAYVDGLNRKLQARTQAKGNNTYALKDWTYNNIGFLASESLPYFASSTARSSATSTSQLFTTYTYDALQRVLKTTNAVGSTSNAYNAWTVTTTDANGKVKDYAKDAYGNLATVVEHVSGQYATTSYAWDLNKSLTKVTDALGNIRNFTYDGLGRRLTAEDLHAPGDASFGSWSYTYDPAGNLTQTVDPKSQTINNGYDVLNRKTTEDYTGQAGVEITNTYDVCNDGKGRLCVASSTASRTAYNYNQLGLQSSASSTLIGTTTSFVTQYGYDRQGHQTLVTYPDNAQVQYNYNSGGSVDAVLEKENGGSFSYIVNNFDYSPLGQPSSIVMGNGAVTTNSFDQNALDRLTKKVTALSNGTHAQDLAYSYDSLGNITRIVDNGTSGTGKVVNYAYDDLSRLLNASTTIASSTPYGYAYTYDALGNITSGPLGTYSYLGSGGSNYADPDAVTAFATTTITTSGGGGISTSTIALTSTTTNITLGFNGTTTKTWTVTTSGSNPLIVLTAGIWQDIAGAGTIASASWNGAAFTKATSTRTTANETEIWYLVASTTGSKTISVTVNGGTDAIKLGTASFSGVSTSSPFDIVKSTNGFSTTPSVTVTPKFSGEAFVDSLAKWTTLDATTSLSALYKDYASSTLMASSYKIATTSGAVTETYTAAGASSDWVLAMTAFRPATTTTGTASTTSATTTLSYDNNGNLTAEGSSTFSWDYRNQMTQSGNGLATSTYAYDQDGNRVKLTEGSVTTFFPNTLYSVVTGATTTKNIFANGMLISTIESASSTNSGGGGGGIATSTPAFVQSKKDSATGSVTLTNPVTTGNFIVVGVTIWNTAIPSNAITDSKGNTYTKVGEIINATTLDHGAIFYAKNVTGGASFAVTSSVGGTIAAHEYSGITVSGPFDKVASSTGFSTVPNSTSITTGNDHDLYFGLAWSNTSGDAWSAAGGYTLRENETDNNSAERIATEDQVISSASTTAALFSLPNNTDWVAMIASFKPATTSSGGGGGSTGSTTVRYIATDNISGSNVVMDANGIAETLDYSPYGALRIDTKSNYGGVRNKYAGTIFDALSGLNYAQARYQNSNRGQFISQDPLFVAGPMPDLTNPQNQNSYSYSNDNPINKSDPTGLLTYVIPGTAYNSKDWSGSGSASSFISSVGKTFGETPIVMNNKSIWSGADNSAARDQAAQAIAGQISQYKFAPGEKLNIVGFSHGGNVGIEVSQLTDHRIDNLITLGTPVRSDYQPNRAMIGNQVSAYSNLDPYQALGGGQSSASELIGSLFLGAPGGAIGSLLNWGEIGPAGRQFAGATNINETANAGTTVKDVHGNLWANPKVWADVSKTLNK
jgi:RHS repeat-associated protein